MQRLAALGVSIALAAPAVAQTASFQPLGSGPDETARSVGGQPPDGPGRRTFWPGLAGTTIRADARAGALPTA